MTSLYRAMEKRRAGKGRLPTERYRRQNGRVVIFQFEFTAWAQVPRAVPLFGLPEGLVVVVAGKALGGGYEYDPGAGSL